MQSEIVIKYIDNLSFFSNAAGEICQRKFGRVKPAEPYAPETSPSNHWYTTCRLIR